MWLPTLASWRCCILKSLTTAVILGTCATGVNALPPEGDQKLASIESMLEGLEKRLEKEPNDAKGWALLGKSYQYMQRIDDAKAAYEKAKKLGYAGSLPDLSSGSNYSSSHHKTGHINSPLASAITEVTNKASTATTIADTQNKQEASSAGIKVKVDIDPETAKKLQGNEKVFVFAKLPKGMPAPLAVSMIQASDLPSEIVLDDSRAMMPGHNISSASEVVIGARISMSGNAIKGAGDIEAISPAISTSQKEAVVLKLSN